MSTRFLVTICGLTIGVSAAWAQSADPVLQGPKVEETSVPGENRTFGQGAQRGDMEIPHRLFLRALGTLRGREAPMGLRLSAEQERGLRGAEDAFRKQQTDYFEQHRDEVRQAAAAMGVELPADAPPSRAMELLRARARGQADDATRRPGPDRDTRAGDALDQAERDKAAAVGRLRELAEGAPKTRDLHTRVWSLLSESQRKHVQSLLQSYREEAMTERRGELGLPAGGAPTPDGQPRRPATDRAPADRITDIHDPRLPASLRERLKGMTPEEQSRALQRINERRLEEWRQTDRGPRGERDGARKAGGKPAPSMDDVEVPPPSDKRK